MVASEKRPVIFGESRPTADSPVLTLAGAKRLAEKMMPRDLRAAGFKAGVYISDPDINGGTWYRIGFGKQVAA